MFLISQFTTQDLNASSLRYIRALVNGDDAGQELVPLPGAERDLGGAERDLGGADRDLRGAGPEAGAGGEAVAGGEPRDADHGEAVAGGDVRAIDADALLHAQQEVDAAF